MPVPVTIVLWPSGGGDFAIGEMEGRSMFDVPAVGSRYWLENEPLSVREVDESSEPVRVHLEHDAAFEAEVRGTLPDGYWVDGGRSHTDGRWHFHLTQAGVDRPTDPFFGGTLESALAAAVASAHQRAQSL